MLPMNGRRLLPVMLCTAACAPATSRYTGAELLNVTPQPPAFTGSYDFDLLDAIGGKACVLRGASVIYWVGTDDLGKLSGDATTRQAIAAAAHDAISHLEDVDTIVITRVVADSQSDGRVCATVYGRGVRLTKASSASRGKEDRSPADAGARVRSP
jgi:hypothetical protein